MKNKQTVRTRRQKRVRVGINGTAARPRLAVFRSLKHISAQLINDETGRTLVAANDQKLKGTKTEKATATGKLLAEKALAAKIKEVVFDRRGNHYHGRVKALAEGARAGGLKF